jgi:hypothetical protein
MISTPVLSSFSSFLWYRSSTSICGQWGWDLCVYYPGPSFFFSCTFYAERYLETIHDLKFMRSDLVFCCCVVHNKLFRSLVLVIGPVDMDLFATDDIVFLYGDSLSGNFYQFRNISKNVIVLSTE